VWKVDVKMIWSERGVMGGKEGMMWVVDYVAVCWEGRYFAVPNDAGDFTLIHILRICKKIGMGLLRYQKIGT